MTSGSTARRWLTRSLWAAGGIVVLAGLVAALVHTPPVRRAVLGRAIVELEERFGIVLEADALRYNLLTLRVALDGVRLAAVANRETPFLEADTIQVSVPRSALFGAFALESVDASNATVTIVRAADGTVNLPPGSNDGGGEPAELPINRIVVSRLSVLYLDRATDLDFRLPSMAVDVTADAGTIRLGSPGSLRRGSTRTTLEQLAGGIAFDGRAIDLDRLELTADEGSVLVDGTVALLVEEPRTDLEVSGEADIAALARWADVEPSPSGAFAFEGTVTGPLASPVASMRLRDGSLALDALAISDITAVIDADAMRIGVVSLDARLLGGAFAAAGELPLGDGDAVLTGRWSDIDVGAIARALAPQAGVVPAARTTGNVSFRGPAADLDRWTIDADARLEAMRAVRGQVPLSGEVGLTLAQGAWALTARSRVAGAPFDAALRGIVDSAQPTASTVTGTVALGETNVPQIVRSARAMGLLELPMEEPVEGIVAGEASLAGTLSSPRMQVMVRGRDLAAAGVAGIAADAKGNGTLDRMQFDARVFQGDANMVTASGTVSASEGRLDAAIAGTLGDPSRLAPDLPIGGRLRLDFDAAGPFDALAVRGTVTIDDARYEEWQLGAMTATVDAGPAVVRVDATAVDFATEVAATWSRTGARRATVDIAVEDADLARLVRDAALPVALSGRLSLAAHAEGLLDDWRAAEARVDVTRLEATAGELPLAIRAPATLVYRDRAIAVGSLDLTAGDTAVIVAGRLPVFADAPPVADAEALRAILMGDIAQVLAAVRATGLVDVPDAGATGPLVLLARVSGSGERPVLAADLELGPGRVAIPTDGTGGGPDVASGPGAVLTPAADADGPDATAAAYAVEAVQVRAHLENGWLDLVHASAEWQGAEVSLQGRAPLGLFAEYLPQGLADAASAAAGDAAFTARVTNLGPRALAPFVSDDTLQQLAGTVSLSARLNAAALAPESLLGDITIETLDVRVGDLPIAQRVPTRVTFGDGFARVAAWDWTGQGASLGVQGQVRLADRVAALRAAGRVDLRVLTPFVREAGLTIAGTLTPLVAITGPLDDPTIDAEVTLVDTNLRLADPRIVAANVAAKAVVTPSGAQITGLTGTVNGGALTGGGRASFVGDQPMSGVFDVAVAGMAIEFPEGLRSELDADLALALSTAGEAARGTLSGTVTVLRSAYREPIAVVTGLLAALRNERLTATVGDTDSFADRLALDVRVVTDSDVIVDNNLARLQLGGDLRLIGTAAAPALSGRAELREGGELFLGRNRYSIDSGTIDFQNPDVIEPNLNVQAGTRAGGVDIRLTLTGTPETLDVRLEAPDSPEQISQADLASLLLTGRRMDDVSGAEAEVVGEQVLSYLSGDLLGAASRLVGLDTIRLGGVEDTLRRDPSLIATETDPTSRMTFGKAFGESLEITLSQSLREADAQTWIVDYRALRQLGLRFVSDDEFLRSYEFRHDLSFGPSVQRAPGSVTVRPPPPRVATVVLTGNPGPLEERLRGALRLGPGDTLDFADWQRDRDRLEEALHDAGYREARVSASREETAAGVALTYEVDAGPLTQIAATGYELPGSALEAIHTAWTQSVFDDFLEEEAAGIAREALAGAGYLDPQVTAETASAEDTKRLTIAIAPGQRTTDRRLAIDAPGDLRREIEDWIRLQQLTETAWREPARVEQAIVSYLESRGYLRAVATTAAPAAEGRAMVLRVTVDPGPVFTIGDVAFEGAQRVDLMALSEAAALTAGLPYSADATTEARTRVLRRVRGAGFADARVVVQQRVDPAAARVDVLFAIEEGPRQVLREVVVAGNRSIDTDVVTRALDLPVGEPLGADTWLQARARLFDTALFRRVDVTTAPIADAPPIEGEQPVRVLATVQEWPALRLRYGFQVSEERPEDEVEGRDLVPGVSADLTRRTLFGRAVTTGGAFEYQRRSQGARAFASAPTMLGLPVESLFSVYRSRQEFVDATLLTDRTGAAWEQRLRVGSDFSVSYSYRYDRDHTFETEPDPDSIFPVFDVTADVARLNAAAVFDTRDDPMDASRGLLLSSSFDYSSDRLGSDVSFVKQLAQAYYFRPWRQVVFASAARLGVAVALDDQPLILSERFYAGGARTVRGLSEEGLGPRDFEGAAAGGGALLLFNQEARFPIFWWFRGVAFVDAGEVFTTPSAMRLGDLAVSGGLGLRVTTPFALLRVDYGRVWAGTDVGGGRWTFGIGQAF